MIDCTPEGHQPDVNTRIFQAVQQPVCIVLASRSANGAGGNDVPARVRFRLLRTGAREEKFEELNAIRLNSKNWIDCPSDWRAPVPAGFDGRMGDLSEAGGSVRLQRLRRDAGRTWIIAPDTESLETTVADTLIDAPRRSEGAYSSIRTLRTTDTGGSA